MKSISNQHRNKTMKQEARTKT